MDSIWVHVSVTSGPWKIHVSFKLHIIIPVFVFYCSNPVCVEQGYTPVLSTMTEDGWMWPDWAENSNSPSHTRMAFNQLGMDQSLYFFFFFNKKEFYLIQKQNLLYWSSMCTCTRNVTLVLNSVMSQSWRKIKGQTKHTYTATQRGDDMYILMYRMTNSIQCLCFCMVFYIIYYYRYTFASVKGLLN